MKRRIYALAIVMMLVLAQVLSVSAAESARAEMTVTGAPAGVNAVAIRSEGWVWYGIALVTSIDEQTLENDQISTEGKAFVVKAEVLKIVVNRQGAKAINRGLFAFLECLVNYSRIDLIDDEAKGKYVDRFLENESLIERVGSEDIKESMSLLKDKMIEKGIEF